MNKELRALTDRLRCEAVVEGERAVEECERLARAAGPEELAGVLSDPGRPLWARELAAYRLGVAKDPRARDDQGRPTAFLRVHAVLIGVALLIALVSAVAGVWVLVA